MPAANNFAAKRSRISHFRGPLIEDRCTSRGSALFSMDEGTVDHNETTSAPLSPSASSRKYNGALALFSGTIAGPKITRLRQRAVFALPQICCKYGNTLRVSRVGARQPCSLAYVRAPDSALTSLPVENIQTSVLALAKIRENMSLTGPL